MSEELLQALERRIADAISKSSPVVLSPNEAIALLALAQPAPEKPDAD